MKLGLTAAACRCRRTGECCRSCIRMRMDADGRPQLLTVREAATELRVTPLTIYRHIESGELPARRIGHHGPLRIERHALDQLLRPAGPKGRA